MTVPDPKSAGGIYRDIARVVLSRRAVSRRVGQLARQIAGHYANDDLTILAVLTGSFIFLADLVRRLSLPMKLNVISLESYPGKTTTPQKVKFKSPLSASLRGRHVLIVDDILDSGQTLATLTRAVQALGPASMKVCVLLRKHRPDLARRMDADFVGFDVDGEFLVGYGLDFDSRYRNLPDICVLKAHAQAHDARPSALRARARSKKLGGNPHASKR